MPIEINFLKEMVGRKSTIEAGTTAQLFPHTQEQPWLGRVELSDGRKFLLRYELLLEITDLEGPGDWEEEVYSCTPNSVGGEVVEPDWFDDEGFPSWPMALGLC